MITRIAVAEPPGIEVEYACEECDEEREAVFACHHVVHAGDDAQWFRLSLCQQTECTANRSHDQCGRNTLACHVANAEIEAIVAHEVVVEVAADLLGRVIEAWSFSLGLREEPLELASHLLSDRSLSWLSA